MNLSHAGDTKGGGIPSGQSVTLVCVGNCKDMNELLAMLVKLLHA